MVISTLEALHRCPRVYIVHPEAYTLFITKFWVTFVSITFFRLFEVLFEESKINQGVRFSSLRTESVQGKKRWFNGNQKLCFETKTRYAQIFKKVASEVIWIMKHVASFRDSFMLSNINKWIIIKKREVKDSAARQTLHHAYLLYGKRLHNQKITSKQKSVDEQFIMASNNHENFHILKCFLILKYSFP